MPILHLLRHGELLPNPERRFVGQRNIPLSEKGRKQARFYKNELSSVPLTEVWSSDLSRCREMTSIITEKRNLPVRFDPDFREVLLGEWEGLTKTEVDARFPGGITARGRDFWSYVPEGGESFAMLARRVLSALQQRLAVLDPNSHVLLVAHAGVNRVILMQYLALRVEDFFSLPQPYAAWTTLFYTSDDIIKLTKFCAD